MKIEIKSNCLEMTATPGEQAEIEKLGTDINAEYEFIAEYLPGFEQITPESVGALTDAPLISNGVDVFGFMDYQVVSFLYLLTQGKTVIWQKG